MSNMTVGMVPFDMSKLVTKLPASQRHLIGSVQTGPGGTGGPLQPPPEASTAPAETTRAERIRAQTMQDMNLNEDALSKMSDKDRQRAEERVRQRAMDTLTGTGAYRPGSLSDISA